MNKMLGTLVRGICNLPASAHLRRQQATVPKLLSLGMIIPADTCHWVVST